ncbi:MAG TPA: phosphate uptake regulator PhoU [Candidatus Nanoarchaeia archaeon]|nr:phosphate uptake regulator PhoU [Candidatus Nanoarchaeia archaeon]
MSPEYRKMQQTPTGTFFVCLPKDWPEKHGLGKGSLVALNEASDGRLFIDPKYNESPLPKNSSIIVGPYLGREIVSHYLLGSDIIHIQAKDRIDFEARKTVKATVASLIGLEIVEESHNQIVLQCLLEPSGFPPEKILRRNYAIVAGMLRDSVNSFINVDAQLAKSVMARDDENNRLYFLLVRILRTIIQTPRLGEKLGLTTIECLDYRLAASLVESMGDTCVQIAAKTLELRSAQPSENLKKLLCELQATCYESQEQALKSFLGKDIACAANVRKLRDKVQLLSSGIEKISKDQPVDVMPQTLATTAFLKQICENSVDLADLVV